MADKVHLVPSKDYPPGYWLRIARHSRGMTQKTLAREADITQVALSHIETGRTKRPHIATMNPLVAVPKYVDVRIENQSALTAFSGTVHVLARAD